MSAFVSSLRSLHCQRIAAARVAKSEGEAARVSELRQRVALGIRKKMEDDLACVLNAINEGDVETVKLLIDQGFKLMTVVHRQIHPWYIDKYIMNIAYRYHIYIYTCVCVVHIKINQEYIISILYRYHIDIIYM